MATNNAAFRQTPEFKMGRTAEELVGDELRRLGWWVIPSYDYCGEDEKAPRLHGPHEVSWVLPDLDICKWGMRKWFEVKAKSSATRTRVVRRRVRPDCELEHGIDLRLIDNYRQVRQETGSPVFICIYECDTRLAFVRNLAVLEQSEEQGRRWHRISPPGEMSRSGMFFFSRADLVLFATLDPLPMPPASPKDEARKRGESGSELVRVFDRGYT